MNSRKGVFIMARKYIDCRDFPQTGDKKCSVAISADSADELLEVAIQHGVKVHGYTDSPELRRDLRSSFKEGQPQP